MERYGGGRRRRLGEEVGKSSDVRCGYVDGWMYAGNGTMDRDGECQVGPSWVDFSRGRRAVEGRNLSKWTRKPPSTSRHHLNSGNRQGEGAMDLMADSIRTITCVSDFKEEPLEESLNAPSIHVSSLDVDVPKCNLSVVSILLN